MQNWRIILDLGISKLKLRRVKWLSKLSVSQWQSCNWEPVPTPKPIFSLTHTLTDMEAWSDCLQQTHWILIFGAHFFELGSFPGGSHGKRVCLQRGRPRFNPWVGKIPWKRKWQPTPVLLPGKSHEWRCLIGFSSWGHKESELTEHLHFHFLSFFELTVLSLN